jgi:hypothetical protein
MKRRGIITVFTLLLFTACDKDQEKTLLNDIIKIHDKVMGNDEALMKDKMTLDTLLSKGIDTAKTRSLKLQLDAADNTMETWMKNFDPEQKGKSHDEIMIYLTKQKAQIIVVDSTLSAGIKQSDEYLKNLKK